MSSMSDVSMKHLSKVQMVSFRHPRTRDKSQLGNKHLTGGLLLKTPFNRRIMYECCPIGQLSVGGNKEDNIEL